MLFCIVCIFTYLLYVYMYENTEVLLSLPAFLQSHALLTLNYKCSPWCSLPVATHTHPFSLLPTSFSLPSHNFLLLCSEVPVLPFFICIIFFFSTVPFVGTILEISPRSSFVITFSFGCHDGWPIGHSSETLVQSDSWMEWHISPLLLLFILICFENNY